MKRYVVRFVVLSCWSIAFWFNQGASQELKRTVIQVGVLAPLTGNWAQLGIEVQRGATLAMEEINQHGGIVDRDLLLDIQDSNDAVTPRHAISAYRAMRQRGIDLFIGPTGTVAGLTLAPIASKEAVIMIAPAVGIQDGFVSVQNNLFNIQGGLEVAAHALAESALNQGLKRMAIFSSQHPFEHAQAEAFRQHFTQIGGSVVALEEPNPEETDVRVSVQKLLQSKPESIFLSSYNQLGLVTRRFRELGYSGKFFVIQIDSSRSAVAHGTLNGAFYGTLGDRSQAFATNYFEHYHQQPSYPAEYAYDALKILCYGIEKSASFAPGQIAAALQGIDWDGASGSFVFNKYGTALRKAEVRVWQD
jgi:branched-chain amino acid transport system substrate-binding protein